MDLFLEHRVRDLVAIAEGQKASQSLDAALGTYRTALSSVEDALALDPSNETAVRLRQKLIDAVARMEPEPQADSVRSQRSETPVKPPSFALLKEGDTPSFDLPADQGGYLPEPEVLSIRDTTRHPEKPDYLKMLAAVLIAIFCVVAGRVTVYYAAQRPTVETRPLPEQAVMTPQAPPQTATSQADDTIYYADSGVTLPILRSKYEPRANAEGKVVLLAVIDPTGKPVNAKIWQGLDTDRNVQAIHAAERWRFQPGTKDGKPVPVIAQLEINFRQ